MTVIFIARKGGTTALMRSRKIFDQEISWDVFQKKAKLLLMLVEHRHVEMEKPSGEKNMIDLKEIAELQRNYQTLVNDGKLSKKALCALCIPFRDKYLLKDSEAIGIARGDYSNAEIVELLD